MKSLMTAVKARRGKTPIQPTPRNRVLRAVRANVGVQAWYRAKLDAAIEQMQTSLVFWVKAQYRAQGFAQDAADGGPVGQIRKELRKLTTRWQASFNGMADSLSKEFAERVLKNGDAALTGHLKERGLTVKFTMTDEMRTAYQAVIGEQVGLIKSIASEHLSGHVTGQIVTVAGGMEGRVIHE